MQPFDHRIDIFALGVVMHEMMTGARLFQAKNDIAKMRQLLAEPIPPPSSINAAVPRELDRIVMKALEIDPTQRYQSATAMAAEFERTMIAARHSSRDLAKLLRGLFLRGEEPLVVVDASAEPGPRWSGPRLDVVGALVDARRHARRTDTPAADSRARKRRRRGSTARCAPSSRASNGSGGRGGSRPVVVAASRPSRLGAGLAYAAKKYLPEPAAAAAAGGRRRSCENRRRPPAPPAAAKPTAPLKATKKRGPSTRARAKGHGAAASAPPTRRRRTGRAKSAMPPSAE